MGFKFFGFLTLKCVLDFLPCQSQVFGVKIALFIKYLGVMQRDGRPRNTTETKMNPSDHVLPHVRDHVAGRGLEDLERLDLTGAADRRPGWSDEQVLAVLDDLSVKLEELRDTDPEMEALQAEVDALRNELVEARAQITAVTDEIDAEVSTIRATVDQFTEGLPIN